MEIQIKETGLKSIIGDPIVLLNLNGKDQRFVQKGDKLFLYDPAEQTISFDCIIDNVGYKEQSKKLMPINEKVIYGIHTLVGVIKVEGKPDIGVTKNVLIRWRKYGERYISKECIIMDDIKEIPVIIELLTPKEIIV